MAVASSGWLLSNFSSTYKHVIGLKFYPIGFLQARNYAARKGTREKARKKKVKVVIQKVGFIPHNKRKSKTEAKKEVPDPMNIILNNNKKPDPIDNVWIARFHKFKICPFEEAVQNHRETHHPTIYNLPNAPIKALIGLDMQTEKKTKFVDAFSRMVHIPHTFDQPDETRKILAFCKNPEMQEIARNAGAMYAGGKELIKQIQNGDFSVKEYDIIVSEPSILPDLLLIRGLMKKKFPNMRAGTLNTDIHLVVTKFLTGVKYTAKPHEIFKHYGIIDVAFGTLDMDTKQLEENFSTIVNDIHGMKPRQLKPFIISAKLISPPSREYCQVDFEQYLSEDTKSKEEAKEEEEEEEEDKSPEAVIASH